MSSSFTKWYHKRRRILIENYGGKCTICNSTFDLVFHHIKPTKLNGIGRGSHKRIKDVINNYDCYQLVCNACHIEIHYKGMDI